MNGRVTERDTVARRHLERLAGVFRRLEVSTELQLGGRPFPGLVVTESGASVLVLAGYATFWRQGLDGVCTKVGPFRDLVAVARSVREDLADQHRSAKEDIDLRMWG